jgi:hypothetical protein
MRAAVIAGLLLAACTSGPTASERDNFKRVMDRQVGKSIDDADAYPVYYRLRQLVTKPLPNGNALQVYAAGREAKCQVGFELALNRQIVRWTIEEGANDCVIDPPRP